MASKRGYYPKTDDEPTVQNFTAKFQKERLLDFRWDKKKKKKRNKLRGGLR
jgi:hypothetical protein